MDELHGTARSERRPGVTWHRRGHRIVRHADGRWRWADGRFLRIGSSPDDPACARCGQRPGPDGEDPCLGWLPEAVGACCGHGVTTGYVAYPGIARVRLPRLGPGDLARAPSRAEALDTVGLGWTDEHVIAVGTALRSLTGAMPGCGDLVVGSDPDEARSTLGLRQWLRSACDRLERPPVLAGRTACRLLLAEAVRAAGTGLSVRDAEAAVLFTLRTKG